MTFGKRSAFLYSLLALAACSNSQTERTVQNQPSTDASTGGTGGTPDAGRDAGTGGTAGFGGGTEAGFIETGPGVPKAPTDLVLQIVNETTIEITWKDNTGGTAMYEIRWSTTDEWPADANATVDPADAGDGGLLTYQVTGLTTGQLYYFWVRAVRQGLPSVELAATKTPVAVPVQPRTILARPTASGTVMLLWNPVPGSAGYNISWSTTDTMPDAPNQKIPSDSTMFDVTGLEPCSTYYFWVAAYNELGTGQAIKASSKAEVLPADPSDLAVQMTGAGASLTWKDNANNESDYTVYWASGTGAMKPASGTSAGANRDGGFEDGGTTTSFVITNLTPGMAYTVWVEAKNCAGTSGAISAAANTANLPAAPTDFAATVTGAGSDVLRLTWAAPATGDGGTAAEVKGYRIYYSQTTTPPKTPNVDNLPPTATSADITGLAPLTTYNFWIVAFNDSGESNPPLTGKAAIGAKPAAPTGFAVTKPSNFRMHLAWNAAPGGGGAAATESWKLDWTIGGQPANASPIVIPVATTSYDLAAINVNSTYVFSLKASNAAADSDPVTSPSTASVQIPGHGGEAIKDAWIDPNGTLHFAWYAGSGGDSVGAAGYVAFFNVTPQRPASGYPALPAPPAAEYSWTSSGFLVASIRYFWGGGQGPDGVLLWPTKMLPGPNMSGNITFSNPAATQVKLDWTGVTGAAGYRCRWSTGANKPTANASAMLVTGASCTVTGLTSAANYNFWVEATGAAIENGATSVKGLPGAVIITGSHVAP